ncbi:16S rRNA (cytidine1402-2'-O)-methyltransferase [Aneurinibacillus soli]|uniref:Ribosomal RNA small subunit methyltransferase I n=1 Tax=Aneurinibacillus soli TaxID=1500254 RepID=A0A0U5C3Q7_9BACL|nr:16S rRNA (cytidine(1402)-2'-O)-methyltransferase [Aneurinibacillus soli]PYE58310.1 16S rRNA (cytidine1402-2'-O)-methyltransferase [Aneurinibacillus soli]BAU26211.1 ribosomal RNA small subunit methyltransferase I [Aneurinibacillus soli]
MFVQKSFADSPYGKLYLVATPIGNLDDMTVRAVHTLREVDIIAAEDTRQTRKLLTHFEIDTRLISYHEHNQRSSGPEIIRLLKEEGISVALVSDAGLPAISDPGQELVRDAVADGISVIPIPGANAALSALIVSGLSTDGFVFRGFLPREKKDQRKELERLRVYKETLIFYESPYRITKTLHIMQEVLGNRQVALGRELTKRYEEFIRGSFDDVLAFLEGEGDIRGEFTVIVAGADDDAADAEVEWWQALSVVEHVDHYIEQGMSVKVAVKQAADDRGVPKRDVYNEYHQ